MPSAFDTQGEPFYLNLHERFHGPHGLIAGTTGSGKSEFIITWILSMCINYSPKEVAFVLIDYKGGGLAGAFDNERYRLPHLAGTITNLDGAAINRSLVSIKSELKRRQALFNEAREVSGGDNIDIYTYLELYHQGEVREDCPHLFIVADEFAELKQQEPEFMDELISAARIGRSLGVHLVLATQKPSGVVNDQIWSNSKFKVCLKVADKQDSNEMIKRADAAEIKEAGRFYLLVGYNEYFALGQSAYTGTPYIERDEYTPKRDDSVVLISNTGRVLMSAKPESEGDPGIKPVSEIVAVLSHLQDVAREEGLQAKQLWLDPIPTHITVDELERKYASELAELTSDPFSLSPIIGELDDPENQSQRLLTLPLSSEGNAVVYGSSGSGVETVVFSLIYSLLKQHTTDTLNLYLMDFGTETLNAFRDAPQVGDVVLTSDEEKIENLFKMLTSEMVRRRKLLSEVGGGLKGYHEQTGTYLPSIVTILQGFEQFSELYERHLPSLIELTRDGIRYGMYFVTTASRANGIPYRVLPNFKQRLTLPLNSNDEYLSIFGSLKGTVPPKDYARGLIKEGNELYEYQGASVSGPEEEFSFVRSFIDELKENANGETPCIPVLPEKVTVDLFSERDVDVTNFPLGFETESMMICSYDFTQEPYCLVSANDINETKPFFTAICELLHARESIDYVVLDPIGIFPSHENTAQKSDEIQAAVSSLFGSSQDKASLKKLIIIPSITTLLNRVDTEYSAMIKEYFEKVSPAESHYCLIGDEATDLLSFGIAPWFKKISGKSIGLWIGGGVSGQTLLRYARTSFRPDDDAPKEYSHFIFKNKISHIKHVSIHMPAGNEQ